jgi:hypothetical protein
MSAFSPAAAALEGFKVLRREPKAVLVWVALWLAVLVFMGALIALVGRVAPFNASGPTNIMGVFARFGPLAALFVPLLLFTWVIQTSATYRAVLEPEDNKWWFLRVGQDEMRLSVVAAVSFLLGPPVFLGLSFLLLVLANPFMQAAPTLAGDIGIAGVVITVLLLIWLGVRLSLIAVETLAENRFHLAAYWPLTRGHFWRLFFAYLILGLILAAPFYAWAKLSEVLIHTTTDQLARAKAASDGGDRLVLWGLIALTALHTSIFFVLPATMFSACQAYAFRAIYGTNYPQDRKV